MTHQSKRPYAGSQPSITSYFPSQNYSISPSPTTFETIASTLPPAVQSNLLSVGMRVRKSVPEGYKTGSSYSAFQLFSDDLPSPHTSLSSNSTATATSQKPKTRPRAGARELTPFCGILKVGGMAQQQWGIYNPGSGSFAHAGSAVEEEDEDEDMPFLSSQGSTNSDISVVTTPNGNKRRFLEDEDEAVGDGVGIWIRGNRRGYGERVMAIPRRKKWGKETGVRIVGLENVGGGFGGDVDFEDAEFLDYEVVGGEVEMSG